MNKPKKTMQKTQKIIFAIILILTISLITGCTTNKTSNQITEKINDDINGEANIQTNDKINDQANEGETMQTKIKIETTLGTMAAKLYDDKVPITTANFKKLASQGFYDGTIFHRIIKDFMVQGGDPTGTGRGGPGYTIKDEFKPELKHDKKGILSMANAGPNTGGSQFFITLVPTPWLNGKHAVFGEITEGIDVLEKIGNAETGANDKPTKEIKITKMTIVN